MRDARGHGRYQRDGNEPEVVDALEANGCVVETVHSPLDLIVAYRASSGFWRQVWLEVKRPPGPRGGTSGRDLNEKQQAFFDRWPPSLRYVVRWPEQAVHLIEQLRLGLEPTAAELEGKTPDRLEQPALELGGKP